MRSLRDAAPAPRKPTHALIGCRDFNGTIRLAASSRLMKAGALPDGRTQWAYRHADTDTWYQVTELVRGRREYRVCEYVGADCPCAEGKPATMAPPVVS